MDTTLGININTGKSYTVLIADDSFSDRQLIKRFLQADQFEVLSDVPSGEGVIDYLKYSKTVPDIIFLDYKMEPKNALETVKEIRPTYPDLMIVIVTSNVNKEAIAELARYKITAYILKPISKSIIDQKLIQILGRKDLVVESKLVKKHALKLEDISIPPLPGIAQKVLLFEGDPVSGSSELEQIILPDKSICADILRIANSAFYGRSKKVQTIKDAITLLGLKTIKNIVMLQSKRHMAKNLVYTDIFKKYLLELPILNALVALDLSVPMGLKSQREELFLCAMMIKIGMTILALNSAKVYNDMLTQYDKVGGDLVKLEKEEFEISHVDVGVHIFKIWQMPAVFQKTMKDQGFLTVEFNKVDDFDRVLRLSEIISKRLTHIPVPDSDIELAKHILRHYNSPEETLDVFDDEYYENIKSHPFFSSM
ncbi:MAG TPA: HDOD domain-containing protein [Leptospiraceae bacterium]|nr:HDOD domain-containing protein [Leptospiraceae bacterium]HMW04251.1 HDOD domain-containing protein [Leptospiraceae bacterium]HMX30597.1 HDOD domain-containing protein [Leptospiraceae bacterium]HMY31297.1 HDOD domain-containing protein [Leptospiraceae bacterium]HMZ63410.1 HDOD domain-containing protein [Leptospiraceae bacterium]